MYAVNFLPTFFLAGFCFNWIGVGMEAIVSDHKEERKGKRGYIDLAELTFTVSKNTSTDILQLKSILFDFLQLDFRIDLLPEVASRILSQDKLKIYVIVSQ